MITKRWIKCTDKTLFELTLNYSFFFISFFRTIQINYLRKKLISIHVFKFSNRKLIIILKNLTFFQIPLFSHNISSSNHERNNANDFAKALLTSLVFSRMLYHTLLTPSGVLINRALSGAPFTSFELYLVYRSSRIST